MGNPSLSDRDRSLQAGQADVDGGGWKYAVNEPNSLRLEFSSSGKVSRKLVSSTYTFLVS
jgi:hypothetical protein